MTGVYGIDLPERASAARIEHELHKLHRNPDWLRDIEDRMFGTNRMAVQAQNELLAAQHQALEAERTQIAALPGDTTPEEAKAYLDDLMQRPEVRRHLNSSDSPLHDQLCGVVDQLTAWANPPANTEGAHGNSGQQDHTDGFLGSGDDDPAQPTPRASQTIAQRKADPEFTAALLDGSHPNHAAVQAEWTGLHEAAAAEGGE